MVYKIANLEGIKSEYISYGGSHIGFNKIGKIAYITFNNIMLPNVHTQFSDIPTWFKKLIKINGKTSILGIGVLVANDGSICEVNLKETLIEFYANKVTGNFTGVLLLNY